MVPSASVNSVHLSCMGAIEMNRSIIDDFLVNLLKLVPNYSC